VPDGSVVPSPGGTEPAANPRPDRWRRGAARGARRQVAQVDSRSPCRSSVGGAARRRAPGLWGRWAPSGPAGGQPGRGGCRGPSATERRANPPDRVSWSGFHGPTRDRRRGPRPTKRGACGWAGEREPPRRGSRPAARWYRREGPFQVSPVLVHVGPRPGGPRQGAPPVEAGRAPPTPAATSVGARAPTRRSRPARPTRPSRSPRPGGGAKLVAGLRGGQGSPSGAARDLVGAPRPPRPHVEDQGAKRRDSLIRADGAGRELVERERAAGAGSRARPARPSPPRPRAPSPRETRARPSSCVAGGARPRSVRAAASTSTPGGLVPLC